MMEKEKSYWICDKVKKDDLGKGITDTLIQMLEVMHPQIDQDKRYTIKICFEELNGFNCYDFAKERDKKKCLIRLKIIENLPYCKTLCENERKEMKNLKGKY